MKKGYTSLERIVHHGGWYNQRFPLGDLTQKDPTSFRVKFFGSCIFGFTTNNVHQNYYKISNPHDETYPFYGISPMFPKRDPCNMAWFGWKMGDAEFEDGEEYKLVFFPKKQKIEISGGRLKTMIFQKIKKGYYFPIIYL